MTEKQTTDPYAALDDEEKAAVRKVFDAMVDALNQYADMMERGEIDMRSGPAALREFAATINVAFLSKEAPDDM